MLFSRSIYKRLKARKRFGLKTRKRTSEQRGTENGGKKINGETLNVA